MQKKNGSILKILVFLLLVLYSDSVRSQHRKTTVNLFAKENLVAWCIVPFDSQNRGPEQRAEMLDSLGISRLAYDWREKNIPEFDKEIETLKKHHIKLQGFWFASGPDPAGDKNLQAILTALKRQKVKTQLWCMFGGAPGFDNLRQEEKVKAMSVSVAYVAEQLAVIGCSLGLYNHGGWFGEPENQIAIIENLKLPNIGMVYNFSHSETQIHRFPTFFPKMLPHLLAINLTGLKSGYPAEVVPVGQGDLEAGLLEVIKKSGYSGPIGIINENFAPDAKDGLQLNMDGLQKILIKMGDLAAERTYR
ncbi:MAG: sugar phosphate isomerase/epimerase family protein [Sphingobacteriaceae bacterium]